MTSRVSRRGVGGLALALVLVLAACAPLGAPAGPVTLTVGLGGEPASLDRNYEENAQGFSIYPAIFEFLVNVDASGKIVPGLAAEWKRLDQGTIEFKLRQGVKFHNGEEFDSRSVKETIDPIMSSSPPAVVRGRISGVKAVEAPDKYTVRISTGSPDVTLLPGLTVVAMYPPGYWKEVGQRGFAQSPVGTGPWKLREWRKGSAITLQRFDLYWGTKPKIDVLSFQFYPEAATRVAALERGEIQVAANVPPDDIQRLKAAGLQIASTPLGQGMIVQLVSRRDSRLADKRVRQALNYAIDKQALVRDLLLNTTKELDGQMAGSDGFGYNPSVKPYPYDPGKAKALLAEAGYPSGLTIKMHSSSGRYVKQREVSEAIAGQLAKVGVKVDIDFVEFATLEKHVLQTYDSHPLFYWGWNYFPVMDAHFVLRHVMCTSERGLFCNQAITEKFVKSSQELDPAKREKLLQEVNAELRDEAPVIFLFQAPDIWGVSAKVKNLKPTPDNALKFFETSIQ